MFALSIVWVGIRSHKLYQVSRLKFPEPSSIGRSEVRNTNKAAGYSCVEQANKSPNQIDGEEASAPFPVNVAFFERFLGPSVNKAPRGGG